MTESQLYFFAKYKKPKDKVPVFAIFLNYFFQKFILEILPYFHVHFR